MDRRADGTTRTVVSSTGTTSVPGATLRWLEGELVQWQADGRLDAEAAASIRARYTASRRLSLGRLMLLLGACFVGVGLLWLVAANLDQLAPGVRFATVVAVWLACVVAAELLAARPAGTAVHAASIGAARLLAAVTVGAVVFQAAQSLQVPAYEPRLLGAWALAALAYGYATAGVAPLLVGVVTGAGWLVWAVAERSESPGAAAVALLLAAVLAAAAAVAHTARGPRDFAGPWRAVAALLALAGLFLTALPDVAREGTALPVELVVAAVVGVLAAAAAAVVGDSTGRRELAVAVAVVPGGWLLLQWPPPDRSDGTLTGEGLLRAVVALTVYVLVADWFAALGVLRDADRLTQLATGALVLFTVVQSFAVFSTVLSGAALFLSLGVVLVVTGWLVGQGRRRLVADVREAGA